ncbi:MAG: aldo/keto reductase, partial [Candidatus Hydrogenedens sp.]|nr:aldo/keto reductase [Candidatus Hydrogenedens sp.]
LCREKGIAVIPYYPLASGFLSGKYRSEADLNKSARGPGIKKYLNERGLRILDALDTVAEKHGTTPAAVALAWLIARPGITAPIASATSLGQLESLMTAARLQLDADSVKLLDTASAY